MYIYINLAIKQHVYIRKVLIVNGKSSSLLQHQNEIRYCMSRLKAAKH